MEIRLEASKAMTQKRYRIVVDRYNGFEAQFRWWWSPIWLQCFGCNTTSSVEQAEAVCRKHAQPVVKYVTFESSAHSAKEPSK